MMIDMRFLHKGAPLFNFSFDDEEKRSVFPVKCDGEGGGRVQLLLCIYTLSLSNSVADNNNKN